ncbi:membrane protein [Sulfolobus acidocaldarius SUSAZ]|nr:membrane protein [Sulfolobus acidocaldarius SUSAZ]
MIVYLTHWFTSEERARAVGLFMSAVAISNAVASPIGGFLLGVDWFGLSGWRWLFILEGIPSIIWGLVVLFTMDDWPKDAKWLPDHEKKHLETVLMAEKESKPQNFVKSIRVGLFHPWVLTLAFVYFAIVTSLYGITFFSPSTIKSIFGTSNLIVGIINGILYTIAAISMIIVGRQSDRTNERFFHSSLPMVVAFIGWLLFYLLLGHASPDTLFISLVIAAIGIYAAFPSFWPVPQSVLAGETRAVAVGWVNSIGNLGGFVGPYIFGYFKEVTGTYAVGALFLGIMALIGGVLLLTLRIAIKRSNVKV